MSGRETVSVHSHFTDETVKTRRVYRDSFVMFPRLLPQLLLPVPICKPGVESLNVTFSQFYNGAAPSELHQAFPQLPRTHTHRQGLQSFHRQVSNERSQQAAGPGEATTKSPAFPKQLAARPTALESNLQPPSCCEVWG